MNRIMTSCWMIHLEVSWLHFRNIIFKCDFHLQFHCNRFMNSHTYIVHTVFCDFRMWVCVYLESISFPRNNVLHQCDHYTHLRHLLQPFLMGAHHGCKLRLVFGRYYLLTFNLRTVMAKKVNADSSKNYFVALSSILAITVFIEHYLESECNTYSIYYMICRSDR